MPSTVPSISGNSDVLITVHDPDKDGSRAVTLVFNDRSLKNFSLEGQRFQAQLDYLKKSTGADFELLNGSKGPYVMCKGSKELLVQGLLADLIGVLGLKARIQFASGKKPRTAF